MAKFIIINIIINNNNVTNIFLLLSIKLTTYESELHRALHINYNKHNFFRKKIML